MSYNSALRHWAARFVSYERAQKAVWPEPAVIDQLAQEYGAQPHLMRSFVSRFAPAVVPKKHFYADADTMLFVHIPKTAGMSVGKAMQQSFDKFHGVEWNNISASFRKASRLAAYQQSKGNVRQVIMGHFGWPELLVWRNQELPIKAGTIFRDPVQRMVSNYNYNSSEAHPAQRDFVKRYPTIESYVEKSSLDIQLTQAIGFVSSFDDVLSKLTNYYSFIGLTERLSQSLSAFSRSHGLPSIKEYRTNVGLKPAENPSENVRRIIMDRNHNDLKIHSLMMRLHDISRKT